MKAYVFCLEPEKRLFSKIGNIKTQIKEKFGEQQYLSDPPHITLYLGKFRNFLDNNFSFFLENLVRDKKININLEDWEVFGSDPITNKETLVCKIKPKKILYEIQKELVHYLSPFREKEPLNRYCKGVNSPLLQKNIEEFGYPFVGEVWKPHIGIASFEKKTLEKMFREMEFSPPKGIYTLNYFLIYQLDESNEKLVELKRYPLKC